MNKNNDTIIEVINLHKRFGDNEVLKGINTMVSRGEVIAIIGPSGCGKSTFLRSINLLEQPSDGQILVDGIDITSKTVDINQMRQRIGMVFQQFNLFPNMTIKRNIMLAPVELGKLSSARHQPRPSNCCNVSAWPTRQTVIPTVCREAKSSE